MSDAFDPYYIWLGIPPEDQPPNHYRLLGVTLFESNREVIEAAANRQMAYMQEVSSGDEHIDEAQNILGEFSKVRICLLNTDKKAAYDAELRASLDALNEAPEETADDPLIPPQFGLPDDEAGAATEAPTVAQTTNRPHTSGKSKKKESFGPIIGLAIVFLSLLVGGIAFLLSSRAEKLERERTVEIVKKEKAAETERRAQAFAERKVKLQAEQKVKLQAEQKVKLQAEQKVKLQAEQKVKLETDAAKKEAVTFLTSKRFVSVNAEWWPDASYKEVEEGAKSLQHGDLFKKNNKTFWIQVGNLLEKRQQLQDKLDRAKTDKDVITRLETLNQRMAALPPIPWLKDTATTFLEKETLEKTEKDIWRLKEEAELKQAKDVESNPTAENLKQFNSAQVQLLKQAMSEYRKVTRKEFQDLLALGNKLGATQGAAFGLGYDGNSGRGGKGYERFNFLGWHHPDCNATEITGPKKDPEVFKKEALQASLARLQNTTAWQKATKKRSIANTLEKKINTKYSKLKKNNDVNTALRVVGGNLPSNSEGNK